MNVAEQERFKQHIWEYYQVHGRHNLAWRLNTDSYSVVVSEIMLQQTQVARVIDKYDEWMMAFPTWKDAAEASLQDILTVWKGLGYNRRGKYLHDICRTVAHEFDSELPNDSAILSSWKGIGINTAGSIRAFAFNEPVVFIETNIRRVFIHYFCTQIDKDITDSELLSLIKATLDENNPREWYWALMDYGSHLPKLIPNPNRKSAHYTKQSKFEGSSRQLRSQILQAVVESDCTYQELQLLFPDARFIQCIESLMKEGLLSEQDTLYTIPKN